MGWMYELFEWTWYMNKSGNFLWATYLSLNAFGWLFIPLGLMLTDPYEEHPYRNTIGVWFMQLGLFFSIGGIGYIIYNF